MRVRLGTPFQAGVVQQQNTALPRLRRRCDSVHPLHFRGCSSSAERSFDRREAKGAAPFVPTISEGIAQPARADASHASGRRCEASCPHHFCPCGVVQPTCLPLMQEITGAKPVRDANFSGAWLTGNSRPTWLRTRQPWTCKSSRADQFQRPQSILSDALAR